VDPTSAFCLHTILAALMGTAIGLERQWGLHAFGLRTNALVCFGAAMFVSLPVLLGGTPAPAHLAGQVITGIGFLGGGAILKEGLNVRGVNTAATLWCSAAVGALAGAGRLWEALVGTLGVLTLNMGLRPASEWLERRRRTARNVETLYRLRVTCKAGQEAVVRAAMLKFFHDHPTMMVQGVSIQEGGTPDRVCVAAEIHSMQRDDRTMEELMTLVNDDPNVVSVSWEKQPAA
jgi:putative Mg2+ transporter-C (MgtC) family protein